MKKIIAALFLSLMPLMAMEIEGIEKYSDIKPHYKSVFTLDWGEWYRENKIIGKPESNNCLNKISDSFSQIKFHSYGMPMGDNSIVSRLSKERKEVLFLNIQMHPRTLSPYLGLTETYVNEEKQFINQCSWKYVYHTIYSVETFIEAYTYFSAPRNKITRKLIHDQTADLFTRVSVVVNNDHYYSFNVLFDTEEEWKKGKGILIELKEKMINSEYIKSEWFS